MRLISKALIAAVLVSASACSKTTMKVDSSPPGAQVAVYGKSGGGGAYGLKETLTTPITYIVKNPNDFVGSDDDTVAVGLVFSKDGYQTTRRSASFAKKTHFDVPQVQLEALNTEVEFNCDEAGAKAYFYRNVESARADDTTNAVSIPPVERSASTGEFQVLGEMEASDVGAVVLPWKSRYTSRTAQAKFSSVGAVKVVKEGFIPKVEQIVIQPGQPNSFSFSLKKMLTTLKVVSDIEGVEVEDIRPRTGLGYVGKTPAIRQFSYQECIERPDFKNSGKVLLTLKCTKAGFVDDFKEVAIPLGEEMTIKMNLLPRSTQITFQTDPPEAHVYVQRIGKVNVFAKTGEKVSMLEADGQIVEKTATADGIVEKAVLADKHLGTTPFTYYMDPQDPLQHSDLLVYRKKFVVGVNTYHKVLTPLVIKER